MGIEDKREAVLLPSEDPRLTPLQEIFKKEYKGQKWNLLMDSIVSEFRDYLENKNNAFVERLNQDEKLDVLLTTPAESLKLKDDRGDYLTPLLFIRKQLEITPMEESKSKSSPVSYKTESEEW